jgi:hypothetical protein
MQSFNLPLCAGSGALRVLIPAFLAVASLDPIAFSAPTSTEAEPRPSDPSGAAGSAQPQPLRISRSIAGPLLGGFVENRGQLPAEARFAARIGGAWTFVTERGLRVASPVGASRGAAVFLTFEGAGSGVVAGEARRSGRYNFFSGAEASSWRTDVPVFDRVRLGAAESKAAVVVRERDGRLAYDLELAPGARLADVAVRVDGADALRLGDDGSLIAETAAGALRQTEPVAWRVNDDGSRESVICAFRLIDPVTFGFSAPSDEIDARPLVVDPSLEWCGYVGGDGLDELFAVDVDPAGAVYYGGRSTSATFPATAGAFDVSVSAGNFDAVVLKLDPSATTLLYATYLGGTGTDRVECLRVNAAGEAYLGGQGGSGWPVTPGAYKTIYGGQGDMFATKLSANGDALVYSTYVGGTAEERGHAIAIDAAGAAYVVGQTLSTTSYGTTGSSILATTDSIGTWNGCVTKVNASGTGVVYSVRFGGSGSDWVYGVQVDAAGSAYVAGATGSVNFNASGTGLNLPAAGFDVFVAKINPTGSAFSWKARLGSPGYEHVSGLELASDGTTYVVGCAGFGFPTTLNAHRMVGDGGDGFALHLAADGGALLYSTFLGGTSTEQANAAALDASGRLYVAGYTNSSDLPVTPNALNPAFNGGGVPADGFVLKLSKNGDALDYASYFGGANDDSVNAVRLAGNGLLWIAGTTQSVNLPTLGGFGPTPSISYEGFGARMKLPASAAAVAFGQGVDAAAPYPTLASGEPVFGAATPFTLTHGPASSSGYLFLAPEAAPWVDYGLAVVAYGDLPTALLIDLPATDAAGAWWGQLAAIPPTPLLEGLSLVAQALFFDPSGPYGLALTNAVRVTFGF